MGRRQRADLTGMRFGRLTVLGLSHIALKWKTPHWLVLCDCGTQKTVQHANLLNPRHKSCGCYRAEQCARNQMKRVEHQKRAADGRHAQFVSDGMKRCSNKCCPTENPQPLANFAPQRARDGHDTRCHECRRGSAIMRKYGISVAEKARRVAAQGGVCGNAGCGRDITGPRKAHIDHNHDSGALRGILCGPCNRALGLLGDSHERVRGLLGYALKHLSETRAA